MGQEKVFTREQLQCFLPPSVNEILDRSPLSLWGGLEEIRLRLNRPLAVHCAGGDYFLSAAGEAVLPEQAYRATAGDLERALDLISSSSLYAFEQELRSGYITIPGGHRVGLCGQAVLENGRVARLKHIAGMNYRVAREISGVALPYLRFFFDYRYRRIRHTLIISPPRGGKTTFLRDLTRWISDGVSRLQVPGFKTVVVDERSEIAGCFQGMPQLNVGQNTDVLDACPKAEGMMMLLRSMAPQVIVTDEIGSEKDASAIEEIVHGGVSVIATAHGGSLEELKGRPGLRRLLAQPIFERALFLGRSRGPGTVEKIVDLEILRQPGVYRGGEEDSTVSHKSGRYSLYYDRQHRDG